MPTFPGAGTLGSMRTYRKPLVVLSKCLEFDACRYDGARLSSEIVRTLQPHVTFVPVCPEVEIGLGTPRDPIRLSKVADGVMLHQSSTGRDLTGKMRSFSKRYLDSLDEVDGFILKRKSPSCGIKSVKLHASPDSPMSLGRSSSGVFAEHVLVRFPGLAIEDERRLTNPRIWHHWLCKLFTLASFRTIKKNPTMGKLVRFQAENKFLLLAYNQKEMRRLGKITANLERHPVELVFADYEQHLHAALVRGPRYTSNINVLMHAMGHFKEMLNAREKTHFLESLEQYRAGTLPISALLAILRSWGMRLDRPYVTSQTFFAPYPEALAPRERMDDERLR